ncbi:MAG TPA: tetratricopeptide repeat protein, partial [Telmatospirillum sp.]|nr:tetratricopeptide repeat protein [Telmatospirillum sp.]
MNRKQRRAEQKQTHPRARGAQPLVREMFATAFQHHQAGHLREAEQGYRQILAQDPRHADSLHLLGVVAGQTGRFDLAIQAISDAIALDGRQGEYHSNLGNALQAQGRFAEAIACFSKALTLNPRHPETHNSIGLVLKELGRQDEAMAAYRKAIDLKPDFPEAQNNLGIALNTQGRLGEAAAAYRKAIDLRPNFAEAYNNLGNTLRDQGLLEDALAAYETALFLKADYPKAHSNFLMLHHYSARFSNSDCLARARTFAQKVERTHRLPAVRGAVDPQRRLRIGYVSADFRAHPVGYFLARVLESHDPGQVERFCYSNFPSADAMTARLRGAAEHWRSIVGMPDAEAAAMIRGDAIDILVDLSGHTDGNRLPLFALKPAPVQVTWLGYFGTTGLSAIDYVLADRFVVPPGEDDAFTETVYRLPDCYLCYSPHPLDIPVEPFPALSNGFVTFGSFNNWTKISAETVATWATILRKVTGSRLFLKTKSLGDADCRSLVLRQFADNGIDADRLILEGASPLADALAAYSRVDIALDPFPFGGGTTTAETLWMGVPLVTRRGERWSGRMSESILATVGLGDWVAKDVEAYVDIACRLAAD